jgi:periplasmic divalent cation tolerance protein
MAAVWVYVTTADQAEAERLGRAAVEARLAACANLLGPTTAVYWWEGKVESGTEAALVLKTRADLVDALTAKIVELHSYDCPCVVALPIAGGNPEFLQWIETETA